MTWLPDPIVTDRLQLRPTRQGDEESIAQLFADSKVRRYLGGALTIDEARRRVGVFTSESTDAFWGHFAIVERSTDGFIGTVSFRRLPADRRSVRSDAVDWEMNYSLRADRWGNGLATEALKVAVAWFREQHYGDATLVAETQAANMRSRRLLERIGASLSRVYERKGVEQHEYVIPLG